MLLFTWYVSALISVCLHHYCSHVALSKHRGLVKILIPPFNKLNLATSNVSDECETDNTASPGGVVGTKQCFAAAV